MSEKKRRFVVVTGGVLSGLGKGVFVSSLGLLLKVQGYNVVPLKIDPYVNIDAGTMNPVEHGEVFVLEDGSEVDMDFGTYERFLHDNLSSSSSITTGKIFKEVIEKERRGEYLGKTVQLMPHVTRELREWYHKTARERDADIVLIEVGGTVGDIENQIFLESLRELSLKEEVFFIHLVPVLVMDSVGEQKTKPAQQSVRMLREAGIVPHMLVCRSRDFLMPSIKEKLSLLCGVHSENVVSAPDKETIYQVPLVLDEQNVSQKVLNFFNLENNRVDLKQWGEFTHALTKAPRTVTIAITGKYMALKDSSTSVVESLAHAAASVGCKLSLRCVETTDIENKRVSVEEALRGADGIIVPGGFGERGVEGKIECIKYAREHGVPFLGLCFGLQLAVVEYARNVCRLDSAHSTEIDSNTPYPVIHIMDSQKDVTQKGGTMRLGTYSAVLSPNSRVRSLYGVDQITERHRHRYEVNLAYKAKLEEHGLVFSGTSPDHCLMEFLEIPDHKFFVATQAHPEFLSRPLQPHPLFLGFLQASAKGFGGEGIVKGLNNEGISIVR